MQDSDMSQISCVQVFLARYESHAARQQRKAVLTVQRRAGKGGTLPSAVHEDHQRNGPQVGTVPWAKSGHAPAQAARHERTRTAKRDVPKALASGSVRLILLRPCTCPCIPRTCHRCALSAGGAGRHAQSLSLSLNLRTTTRLSDSYVAVLQTDCVQTNTALDMTKLLHHEEAQDHQDRQPQLGRTSFDCALNLHKCKQTLSHVLFLTCMECSDASNIYQPGNALQSAAPRWTCQDAPQRGKRNSPSK